MSKITPPPALTTRQKADLTEPWAHINSADRVRVASVVEVARDQQWQDMLAQQEPFGYFRAEPFGWTDCAEDDDGAVPLYAAPVAQAVPAGCKVVPADPTLEMGWAYLDAAKRRSPEKDHVFSHDGYRAMLAAAPEQPAPVPLTEWQPIETAPKDGSIFMCWVSAIRFGETDYGQQYQHDVSQPDFCWWRSVPESPDGGYFDPACGQIADQQHVTHWMPLPESPAIERAHGITPQQGEQG